MKRKIAAGLAFLAVTAFAEAFVMCCAVTPVVAQATITAKTTEYSCPMHPEVKSRRRGKCPKCGMFLKAVSPDDRKGSANPEVNTAAPSQTNVPLKPLQIPETTVYDQDGRKLSFYTDLVKGKTVAINFIFTTCTTVCPPLTATFRRVQQDLGERVGRDIQLISISVDPTTDVPSRLKSFSEKFKAGPGWSFITGSKPEIDGLLRALGASVPDKNNHTSMLLVGNESTQYWTRLYGLAPSSTIAKAVSDAADKSKNDLGANEVAVQVPVALSAGQGAESNGTKSPAKGASNYFPNVELLTQDNKPVRLYDDLLKGKIVLINFMFTTCNGVCSPMTANLTKVQKYLGDHVGKEVSMISISVDPTVDTPAVLKKYAATFKVQPGWHFLTGDKRKIDQALYKLGGYVEDKSQHSSVLIIGDEANGDWMKVPAMSSSTEIASIVTKLIASREKANEN